MRHSSIYVILTGKNIVVMPNPCAKQETNTEDVKVTRVIPGKNIAGNNENTI